MTVKFFIDGALVDGATMIDVINPSTGKTFEVVPEGDEAPAELTIAVVKR